MKLEKHLLLHRLTGFTIVIFVLFLAITGIFLNHTDQLKLDEKYLRFNWLLDLYHMEPAGQPVSFRSNNAWITLIESSLYFNDTMLQEYSESLKGMVEIDGIYVVAVDNGLLLISEEGQLIEKITAAQGVPARVLSIGRYENNFIMLATTHGNFATDMDFTDWRSIQKPEVEWSMPGTLPEAVFDRIMTSYRGQGISVERVMLDLHSGRLFGNWSIFIIDLVAILIILSALSGLWIWHKKKKMLAELR